MTARQTLQRSSCMVLDGASESKIQQALDTLFFKVHSIFNI